MISRIKAHGIDSVEISKMAQVLHLADEAALLRYFTETELADVELSANRTQRLAGRLAVKEAVLKAIATGWGNGISFADIEVTTATTGRPTVALFRQALVQSQALGISHWLVSTTHTSNCATASVLALASD